MKVLKGGLAPLILREMIIKQKTVRGKNDASRSPNDSLTVEEEH